ncbi:MAG: hypothetical protein HY962_07665 [Ignavibacteriae bacterium]|nr:hypothetical protein [Ignavibacteriota bacterium]
MKLHRCVFVLVTALCLIHAVSYAQDPAEETLPFFTSPRLALLFHVTNLSLTNYDGGVGLGFRHNDAMYWRVAVGVSTYGYDWEHQNPDRQRELVQESSSDISTTLFAAPMLLLHQSKQGFVFVSPMVGIVYGKRNSEWGSTDTGSTYGARNTTANSVGARVGFGVGGGLAISDRLMLTAEYRLQMSYDHTWGETKDTRPELYISPLMTSKESRWNLGSYASLTLLFML